MIRIPSLDRPDKGNFREKQEEALNQMNEKMKSRGQKVDVGKLYKKEGMPKHLMQAGRLIFTQENVLVASVKHVSFMKRLLLVNVLVSSVRIMQMLVLIIKNLGIIKYLGNQYAKATSYSGLTLLLLSTRSCINFQKLPKSPRLRRINQLLSSPTTL